MRGKDAHLNALRQIHARLAESQIDWVVTGSLGMALQGMVVEVHDIDLQTNEAGAYEIARRCAEFVVVPVHYLVSERIRSHLGAVEIDGIQVEIMGALQKLRPDQTWEPPVDVTRHRRWVKIQTEGGPLRTPVLSLAYEYQAYLQMGHHEKAARLKAYLEAQT